MKKPPIYIPDACIALAYILKESIWKKQIALFFNRIESEEVQCYVPNLWYYEMGNILMRKQTHLNNIEVIFHNEFDLSFFNVKPSAKQAQKTFNLCQKYNNKISFYDASYHALAIEFEGKFLTADQEYYNLTQAEGNIEFIEDYK